MNKPHWRCDVCDASRFKVMSDKSIKCYNCGFEGYE